MAQLRSLAAAALAGMALTAPAVAQDAASDAARLRQMLECDAIKVESVRLSCYDSAARRNRAALGAGRFGMLPSKAAAQPATPQQRFGMTAKIERQHPSASAQPAQISEITVRIASARDAGVGLWQFAFVDGSRWRSTESVSQLSPPRAGQEVRIRKASMGSYLMYVGQQPSFRVERVN